MADTALKQTPLHDEHLELDARMVPFAGYSMPVQYATGIVKEHQAVRSDAGLFDVSHMGELEVRGPEALELIQHLLTNDASKLAIGQAQYTILCKPDGGALDDCLVYRFEDRYMVVVNAANLEKDRAWFESATEDFDVELADRSAEIALLALQGPKAQTILSALTDTELEAIGFYRFEEGAVAGVEGVISRTGYTGEDGFELYVPAGEAATLWQALLRAGTGHGLLPAGLGARDSLRLEVGYILYGNDLDEEHSPIEAGLGWAVKPGKGEFVGRDVLARQKEEGVSQKLTGFVLQERGFPRTGYAIRHQGETVGEVTSGVLSHSTGDGIGMGYLPAEAAEPGTEIHVVIRDTAIPATVQRPPFYTDGSLKR
ncbi:MAG: glycine cleavage system aminomethyltransferase GcvT [Longimicrobiales bacterium]|nr:glycine cleavage system aminomethyltransferase GcvT [Longimicrobiales bacterium]